MGKQWYTEISVDELLARYQAGERSFIDISVGGEFHDPVLEEGVDLQGITIIDSALHGLVMDNANLSDAILRENSFETSSFDRVNMVGSVLDGSSFSECSMRGTILSGASLESTSFKKSSLEGLIASGTNFYKSTFYTSTGMERVNLTDACLSEITAVGIVFYGAVLVGADLTGANIVNTDLRFADLTGAVFDDDTNDWHCLYCQTIVPDGTVLNDHCSLKLPGDDGRKRALQQARSQEM